MIKCGSRCIIVVFTILLIFCFNTAYAENNIQYQIAYTGASISLPSDWLYGDRETKDNDEICKVNGFTSKQFLDDYLYDDYYAFAYSDNNCLWFTYSKSKYKDYTELSDENIMQINGYLLNTEDGDTIISSAVLRYDVPFFKFVNETANSSDMVIHGYVTTFKEMVYTFYFIYYGDYSKHNDELFDSIMSSVSLGEKDTKEKKEKSDTILDNAESFRFDDFFLFTRKNYVYTTRDEKDLDYTSQFVFDHDYHVKALVSYDGFYTQVASYPRTHKTALSDNECLVEIIDYAEGGFSALTRAITVEKIADNCYMISGKDDVTEGVNVEFIDVYVFHKNGIVEISTNHTFVNDGERNRCIAFLKDLASCVLPLEEMPMK